MYYSNGASRRFLSYRYYIYYSYIVAKSGEKMVEPIYILVSKAGTVIAALKSFDSAKKKYLEFYSLYPKIADDYLSIQAIELKD